MMTNQQKLFVAGWILAAFLVLLYNGAALMKLYSPPISKEFEDFVHLRQKWEELCRKKASAGKDSVGPEIVFARYIRTDCRSKPRVAGQEKEKAKNNKAGIRLPKLEGVIRSFDVHGRDRRLAMIDGRILSEQDRLSGFSVHKITERGVILKKGGRCWFVAAPQIKFSLDYGG